MNCDISDDNSFSDEESSGNFRRVNRRVDKYEAYLADYRRLEAWREKNNKIGKNEDVLLDYFTELSENHKPTGLWSAYSKLKLTMKCKDGIDLGKYRRLAEFLRDKNRGYKSSRDYSLLSNEQVRKFLIEAPEEDHLANKVRSSMQKSG